MKDVEQQIRQMLSMPLSARAFSDALFSPYGLFNKLVGPDKDRAKVAGSPLFKQAQKRLSELEHAEAEEILAGIKRMNARLTGKVIKTGKFPKTPAKSFPRSKTGRSNSQRKQRKSG